MFELLLNDVCIVYFLYPETSGVRLEDMDLLFGDASTTITPATQGERGSLMSPRSPVPPLDIQRQYGRLGADNAIPGLDIDPPMASSEGTTKPGPSKSQENTPVSKGDGIGGWISNMVSRHKRSRQEQYKRLDQGEEDDEQ